MAAEVLFGGVSSVKFDLAGGDFSSPLLTVTQWSEEGNTWPKPASVKKGINNNQEGPTGQEVPFLLNALNVDAALVDTLRLRGFSLLACDVRFDSLDGAKRMTLLNVIVIVETMAIAEFGEYGVVEISGKATSAGSAKAYTLGAQS